MYHILQHANTHRHSGGNDNVFKRYGRQIKEEQEKLEDMAKEIKAAAEPLRRFLEKFYDPTVEVVVDTGVVTVKRGEYMTIFQKEEVPEENE